MSGAPEDGGARRTILGQLTACLGPGGRASREAAVAAWPDRDPSSRPARPARATAAGTRRFADEARRNGAVVIELDDLATLPGALAAYMRERNLGGRLRLAAHPALSGLDWSSEEPLLMPESGAARPDDELSVAVAAAGAAETGSVLFVSGAQTPAGLHVLPLHHVSVIREADIEACYEDALARIRRARPDMPRALNMITGPSRTADIEQTLLMGAHGPQSEVVIIVGGS